MLGLVFTEFMDMVEDQFSAEVLDDVLDTPNLSSDGAFTSVGYYDHNDMIQMVGALSKRVNVPIDDLIEAFGRHLFSVLASKYPALLEDKNNTLEMLESVDGTVHREVLKLYPQAELPEFKCQRLAEDKLTMDYSSRRPFSLLALGLIKGCADHFGEVLAVSHQSTHTEPLYHTRFEIHVVNQ